MTEAERLEIIDMLPLDEFEWLRDHGWQVSKAELDRKHLQINTTNKELRRPRRHNPETAWRFHVADHWPKRGGHQSSTTPITTYPKAPLGPAPGALPRRARGGYIGGRPLEEMPPQQLLGSACAQPSGRPSD